jgi:hypothetical protein
VTPYDSSEYRYLNDPAFRHVVDCLQAMILNLELTPSEIREAAMYACCRIEMRRPSPIAGYRPVDDGGEEVVLTPEARAALGLKEEP